MNIRKVKYNSKAGLVEIGYEDEFLNQWTVKKVDPPHPDFVAAMDALVPYFMTACEFYDGEYKLTAVSINESDDVVYTGQKTLSNKKVINIISPASEPNGPIHVLLAEAIGYLKGKTAQLELKL